MPVNTTDYLTPNYALACVRLLRAISAPDPLTRCKVQWLANGWGAAELEFFESTRLLPGVIAAITPTQIFVGVSGTDTIDQVLHYTAPVAKAAVDRLFTPPDLGVPSLAIPAFGNAGLYDEVVSNDAFRNWGQVVADKILEADDGVGREIVLTGHSYGGAVVFGAACLLREKYTTPITIVTFGAPKFGGKAWRTLINGTNFRAWINYQDPIPSLPPTQGEIGFPLKLSIRLTTYLLAPHFLFVGPAYVLAHDGTYWTGENTPLSPGLLQIVTSSQFLSDMITDPIVHLLAEYERRLALWEVDPQPPLTIEAPVTVLLTSSAVEHVPAMPIGGKLLALQAAKRLAAAIAHETEQMVSVSSPWYHSSLFSGGSSMPYVPTPYTARKMKHPDDWGVSWEGDFIALGTRSQCHSLSKALNHFLRRLQVMAGFDQVAFNAAISIYINEASAGGLNFKPDRLPVV